MDQIPNEMLDAAYKAAYAKNYCTQFAARMIVQAVLEAAGVPALLARIAELEAENEELALRLSENE